LLSGIEARQSIVTKILCVVMLAVLMSGEMTAQTSSPSPRRDINAVLSTHDQDLLAIPGVVGVYVGLLDDGRTPCLKIMLAKRTPQTEKNIPQSLEGYPVVVEVTGEIRPLGK
jgi:hypothetical protein